MQFKQLCSQNKDANYFSQKAPESLKYIQIARSFPDIMCRTAMAAGSALDPKAKRGGGGGRGRWRDKRIEDIRQGQI